MILDAWCGKVLNVDKLQAEDLFKSINHKNKAFEHHNSEEPVQPAEMS